MHGHLDQPPNGSLARRSSDEDGSRRAPTSLMLGGLALLTYFLPPICVPLAITGIVKGIAGQHSQRPGRATIGITLSAVALGLTGFLTAFILSFPRPLR